MTFEQLKLNPLILKALQDKGYEKPTPIQEKAIPLILNNRDVLGCAQTGTGKTAAFAIPILQILTEKDHVQQKGKRPIRSLILTPTRELAIQIEESFHDYGKHLKLKNTVIFGGVSQHAQTTKLASGIDILVATPGRLLDLINQGFINLSNLEIFVLDEADRMLDMGFLHDVKKIIALLPKKRHTLFFSATMPKEIQGLANTILRNPEKVEVTPASSTAETIQQTVYFTDRAKKRNLLKHLLLDKSLHTVLVFTRTKHGADRVTKDLNRSKIKAEAIHGNKSQNSRQKALTNFKTKQTRVLVATDIAARGIDVDDLSHVINYEVPNIPETYVHRIGRTGRAGANGISFTFCDAEEQTLLKDIEKTIGFKIPAEEDHPFPMEETNVGKLKDARTKAADASKKAYMATKKQGGNKRRY